MGLGCLEFGVSHVCATQWALLNILLSLVIALNIVLFSQGELLSRIFILVSFDMEVLISEGWRLSGSGMDLQVNVPVIVGCLIWARNLF